MPKKSAPIKSARFARGGPQALLWRAPISWGQSLAVLLVLVLVAYLVIAAVSPGYVADIGTNKTWGRYIAREGIHNAYRIPTDYPPVLLYFFGAAGWIYQTLVDPSFNERAALASQFYTFLVKLPAIIFHAALALVIYLSTRRFSPGLAFVAAAAYALNPAVAYDVAHLGQTDPVHATFSVLAVVFVLNGRPGWAGACLALAALTKPQAWILVPLVGLAILAWLGRRGCVRACLGGLAAALIVLSPWLLLDRIHHLPRFFEYLETKSINSIALTAQAHNLWWIPTLIEWRFITDAEPMVGSISYRVIGLGMVALLLLALCSTIPRMRPRDRLFGVAATLVVGWFALTVRAHENHLFMAIPLLTLAWAFERRYGILLVMVSIGLLMNIALHDPLLVSNYAAGPDPGQPLPAWIVTLQVVNVVLNLISFGLALAFARGLVPRFWGAGR